jgi:AraC-like DNA-binding protein
MKPIINISSISEINNFVLNKTNHPLVAVIDFSKIDGHFEEGTRISCDFYAVMFKSHCSNKMRYGRQTYDFQDGSLVCFAPKQVVTLDSEIEMKKDMMGWGLYFHPDLLLGTSLANKIKEYTFFSYDTSEALHLSDKEKQTLFDCIHKIEIELTENIDNHRQTLIASNIELLLNYCSRYYGRQFITRKQVNSSIVSQVENLLTDYFKSERLKEQGLPSVKYLSEEVHLSASYLSDLLKKETGMNAQDLIHYRLIEKAKITLLNSDRSVSEVAYSLGFEYPQYFSKLFKMKTGVSPNEFRSLN